MHATEHSEQIVKLVCFRIHDQEYAVDIAHVKETLTVRPITNVFLTPNWLSGIMNLRGDIVAVLDLACFCGLAPTYTTSESRIIICQHGGKLAGVVVDELAELRTLARARINPPPSTLKGDARLILAGIATVDAGAPLRVLDMKSLFESERLRVFQRGES